MQLLPEHFHVVTDDEHVKDLQEVAYAAIWVSEVEEDSKGDGEGKCMLVHLFAPYWLNYSLTDLMTDLPMVCKFKFVLYGHIKKY